MRTRLPTGIPDFRTIREGGYHYVDKTPWAKRMIDEGRYFFLSRPRRFGKSLFLNMLKELFEGNKKLFEGLAIHPHWDWSVRHPVVRISFGSGHVGTGRVSRSVMYQLRTAERLAGVTSDEPDAPERLANLLRILHEKTGNQAVVLVDEYDKPLVDALGNPDLARDNREFLSGLYATLKDCAEHVRFAFLTGISRFSGLSVFSGLNNLDDITLDPRYSAVCGYTDDELDDTFAAELVGLNRDLIRQWYDGYSWLGRERVYNPYGVLLLLNKRLYQNYWFRTGTPTFVVETLIRQGLPLPKLDGMTVAERQLSARGVGQFTAEALLFQTGYLTILDVEGASVGGRKFRLGYPNREVRRSFRLELLDYVTGNSAGGGDLPEKVLARLAENDFEGLRKLFNSVFANYPHQWYANNPVASYEGYYATVFFTPFLFADAQVTPEDSSGGGRADMVVRHAGSVYVFEFKVIDREGEPSQKGTAMRQMRERGYAAKYEHLGQPIHLVAVEFSAKTRNIDTLRAEPA